jgi:hypothetical protein
MLLDIRDYRTNKMVNGFSQPPASSGNFERSSPTLGGCAQRECPHRAVLSFDSLSLCTAHLLSHCYSRLEAFEALECSKKLSEETGVQNSVAGFLDECVSKLAIFLVDCIDLHNLERARLLDILLWANELGAKQRSSLKNCRVAGTS